MKPPTNGILNELPSSKLSSTVTDSALEERDESACFDSSKVSIELMGIDDLADVFHLGEILFTSGSTPILYRTWDAYEVTGAFQTNPDTSYVARDDQGRLAGFGLGTIIEKDTAWTYGYVTWLGVHPDWQGMQVGERLMAAMEHRMALDGVRMFLVDTSADNTGAIRFFDKMGYGSREEHLYLWKTLRGDAETRQRHTRERSEELEP